MSRRPQWTLDLCFYQPAALFTDVRPRHGGGDRSGVRPRPGRSLGRSSIWAQWAGPRGLCEDKRGWPGTEGGKATVSHALARPRTMLTETWPSAGRPEANGSLHRAAPWASASSGRGGRPWRHRSEAGRTRHASKWLKAIRPQAAAEKPTFPGQTLRVSIRIV